MIFDAQDWGFDRSWRIFQLAGDDSIILYDHYGYFTYLPFSLWEKEIICNLPEDPSVSDLDKLVRKLMKDYQHLYCCVN